MAAASSAGDTRSKRSTRVQDDAPPADLDAKSDECEDPSGVSADSRRSKPRKQAKHQANNVRLAYQRARRANLITTAALVALRERASGVDDSIRPLLGIAFDEQNEITADLGGKDRLTAMQRAMLDDFSHLGLLARANAKRFLQHPTDSNASAKAVSAYAGRAKLASMLGLGRVEEQVADLETYVSENADKIEEEAVKGDDDVAEDAEVLES